MAELRRLYAARVAEDEIDDLGHMNVRYYLDKALRGTHALAADLGLEPAYPEDAVKLRAFDLFTRHFREQLVGAPLEVWGGVLDVRGDGLRLYHELRNVDTGDLAASFAQTVRLEDVRSRATVPLPEIVAERASKAVVAWPERGRPRTLDLDATPRPVSLEEARGRGLAMREPREILPEECDAEGVLRPAQYQNLQWGGTPIGRADRGPGRTLEDGTRFGWATLESRGLVEALPPAGTRIQSFGAEVETGRKTSLRHHWVYDLDTGRRICTSIVLAVAFDIDRRRAMEIPESLRREIAAITHPELR